MIFGRPDRYQNLIINLGGNSPKIDNQVVKRRTKEKDKTGRSEEAVWMHSILFAKFTLDNLMKNCNVKYCDSYCKLQLYAYFCAKNIKYMKRLVIASLFLLPFFAAGAGMTSCGDVAKVYICTGPKARVYHKTDECRGLDRCSGDVKSVSLEQAKGMGRRECRICYK